MCGTPAVWSSDSARSKRLPFRCTRPDCYGYLAFHQEIDSIGFFGMKPESLIKAERRIKLFNVDAENLMLPQGLPNQFV